MTLKPSISSPSRTLDSIRARLDIIDQRLHEALIERMDYMRELAEWKKSQKGEKTGFHPAREAKVLRQRAAAHRGAMPVAAVIHIWREIFAASLRLQTMGMGQNMPISIYAPQADCLASAQSWAGAQAAIMPVSDLKKFFADIDASPAMIGLMPIGLNGAWWTDMGQKTHIVARWPFITSDPARPLYVLANIRPEMSGDDISIYALNGESVDIKGFIPPDHEKAPQGRFLGGYARILDA